MIVGHEHFFSLLRGSGGEKNANRAGEKNPTTHDPSKKNPPPQSQQDILNLCYVCDSVGLKECSAYWYQVIAMNDYQKQRFVERVIGAMFNTVSQKRIAVFGFAFKKDTGDTRETPAIDVCRGLLADNARVVVYDPKVAALQVFRDLSAPKFAWDRPYGWAKSESRILESVQVVQDPYEAAQGSHAVCVLTEWDEFRSYDWQRMYDSMMKPAFVFDGRNLLDHAALRKIGFIVYSVGKPLDPFLTSQ